MKKNIVYLMLMLLSIGCFHSEHKLSGNILKNNTLYFDPVCGDSVKWNLHFQDGFENANISLVYKTDTTSISNVSTEKNSGCTNLSISFYKEFDKFYLFTHFMPEFNRVTEFSRVTASDSVNVILIIDGKSFNFKESLMYQKFFGINYTKNHSINYLKSAKCFTCQ